jgi:hypothetical protein
MAAIREREPGHKDASITLRVYAHWLSDASTYTLVDRLDDAASDVTQASPADVPRRSSARAKWCGMPFEESKTLEILAIVGRERLFKDTATRELLPLTRSRCAAVNLVTSSTGKVLQSDHTHASARRSSSAVYIFDARSDKHNR